MTSTTTTTTTTTNSTPSAEELHAFPAEDTVAAKAAKKRYEGLVTVRTKAVKGKGAWYWAHLEPILVRNPATDLPKAVKLRCSLCDAVFSASNPSRTATEHLKRGTCPNIASVSVTVSSPIPLSSLPPPPPPPSLPPPQNQNQNHRKRISDAEPLRSLAILPALSGGRDDLTSLAMLESSVKRLKSPGSSPSSSSSSLTKEQIDSAVELLAEWFYESLGSVSFSALDSPKFRAFLARVGLPPIPRAEFSGARLDAKFGEAKAESDARIDDAVFFQVAAGGWEESLVRFTVNLPNRSSVFQKSVVAGGPVPSKHAEEILWTTVEEICSGGAERCVGIVSDKYKNKAMRNLEARNPWMVNLGCQLKGIASLIKDFNRDFPLFRIVAENCSKIAEFVNSDCRLRRAFHRYRARELLRSPLPGKCDAASLEDFLGSSRALQMAAMDESLKLVFSETQTGRDVAAMVQSESFWNELDSVYTLAKIVRAAAREVETERPLIGQSLPLWEDLRRKVSKDWSSKSSPADSATVEKIIDRRFKKNYHPAMAAAFILDPLNLTRDSAGKYLPPFKFLTAEQEKDVDRLVTRLVGREEAHIALMELMKWRSEGLDPLYAQAVQMKQRDPATGKMRIANPQSSRLVWETCLSELKTLGRVAIRLVFLQATSFGFKCNWSFANWIFLHRHSRVGLERAQKMLFVAAHAKLDRKDFSSEDERDAELFAGADHDDILNDVFADAHSV